MVEGERVVCVPAGTNGWCIGGQAWAMPIRFVLMLPDATMVRGASCSRSSFLSHQSPAQPVLQHLGDTVLFHGRSDSVSDP